MKLNRGQVNNCEKCFASYGQYGGKNPEQWSEYWCRSPELINVRFDPLTGMIGDIKPQKGLCQFCNVKSEYYNKNK